MPGVPTVLAVGRILPQQMATGFENKDRLRCQSCKKGFFLNISSGCAIAQAKHTAQACPPTGTAVGAHPRQISHQLRLAATQPFAVGCGGGGCVGSGRTMASVRRKEPQVGLGRRWRAPALQARTRERSGSGMEGE
jgi:hypothetical protein